MNRLAIIDIGSNSMRILIVEISENKYYEIIDQLKATVRLGKDMTEDGELNKDRMNMAIESLSYFKRLCDSNKVTEIVAVATEAVRKASNQMKFINEVKDKFEIDIRVLTGEEEAYHDYLGAINSLDINSALLMDIGGSSTEFILVKDRKIEKSISIPIGAITLTDKFLSLTGNTDKKLKEMNKFLNEKLKSVEWLRNARGMDIVGIGGSFRTVGKIHRNKYFYPLNNTHNYRISSKQVTDIYNSLKYKEISQYKKVKGISKDRADIFLGAITAIAGVIKYCKSKQIIISENGIRQGVLYRKLVHGYPPVISNILDFSLSNIVHNFSLDKSHIRQVWKLSRKLAEKLLSNSDLIEENYKILKTAVYLHDCGIFVDFNNNEKYSFPIIRDLRINGLTHREQLMAAFASSDFDEDKIRNSQYFNCIVTDDDIPVIQKMSTILLIAAGMDRAMDGNIINMKIEQEKDSIILKLVSQQDHSLEISTVSDYRCSFEKAFGKKLIIK